MVASPGLAFTTLELCVTGLLLEGGGGSGRAGKIVRALPLGLVLLLPAPWGEL